MSTLLAHVAGDILLANVPPGLTVKLRSVFSYQNPEHVRAVRFGADDRGLPPRLSVAHETPDGGLRLPRGTVDNLKIELAEAGFSPDWLDERRPGGTLDGMLSPRFELRDYQQEAVDEFVRKVQGLVVLPCAGGKTTVGIGVIERLRRSTIVLVHTDDLVEQWSASLKEKLGVEPALVRSQRHKLGPVTVASVFTAVKLLDACPTLFNGFGLAILDEAHHSPASTFARVLNRIPARYRLGLTATPEREDRIPIGWYFGPVLATRGADELIEAGYLMRPTVRVLETAFKFTHNGATRKRISELHTALAGDANRNDAIVLLVKEEAACDHSTLVLTSRRDHCDQLGRLVAAAGIPCGTLTGRTPKRRRAEVLDEFKAGKLTVVVATQLADEGLDIERLARIVLAFPERAEGKLMQRLGRLMRLFDKAPELIDVVDPCVGTLSRRYQARLRVYRKLGLLN